MYNNAVVAASRYQRKHNIIDDVIWPALQFFVNIFTIADIKVIFQQVLLMQMTFY